MLALHKRRRGHGRGGGGGGGEEEPPMGTEHLNGLITIGKTQGVKGGLGCYAPSDFFAYPQGVVDLTHIVQIDLGSGCNIALDDEGRVWNQGGNGEAGAVGVGYPKFDVIDWFNVGGVATRLYRKEVLKESKTAPSFTQPDGPFGPKIPTKAEAELAASKGETSKAWTAAAVSTAAAHCLVLTSDGRCLTWGSGTFGAHGNGFDWKLSLKQALAEEGKFGQYAPWWVQTGGPIQGEAGRTPSSPNWADGTASNILTGVLAISCAQDVNYFLMKTGEVRYSGKPAGLPEHLYAEKDPAYTWDGVAAHKPSAIVGTHGGYMLLQVNGEVVWVGNNTEFSAGSGTEASPTLSTREVLIPKTPDGKPAKDVIAIAKGDFSIKLLKSPSRNPAVDGTVWTAGSNRELQQDLPGRPVDKPVEYVTQVPEARDAEGALHPLVGVIAISGCGEETHGGPPVYGRGPGANGGDSFIYLMADRTIRVSSINWVYNTGVGVKWEGSGSLGRGDTQNSDIPVEPMGVKGALRIENVTLIAAGVVHMMVAQEPGAAASPSMSVTSPAGGIVSIDWHVPGDGGGGVGTGKYPLVREESGGFKVALEAIDENAKVKGGPNYTSKNPYGTGTTVPNRIPAGNPGEGSLVRSYTFSGVTRGRLYQVRVTALTGEELLQFVNGSGSVVTTGKAVGDKATLKWKAVKQVALALVLEVQRIESTPTRGHEGEGAVPFNLSGPTLSTAGAITSLPVAEGIPEKLSGAKLVKITDPTGVHSQLIPIASNSEPGATAVSIAATTPNFAYPAGSTIVQSEQEDWKRIVPDFPASATEATITLPPSPQGITGQDFNVRGGDTYESAWKNRIRTQFVP